MSFKKRPCRVCRRWFKPSRQGGHHQKTCGQPECRQKWKKKKSSQWREKNHVTRLEDRLASKVKAAKEGKRPKTIPEYPFRLGREVMGVEHAVFIEFILQLLYKRLRAVTRPKRAVNKGDPGQQLFSGRER